MRDRPSATLQKSSKGREPWERDGEGKVETGRQTESERESKRESKRERERE